MNYDPQKLEFGKTYHIHDQGNNGIDIFMQPENYSYFLKLYARYIDPIAETLAWTLLPSSIHFLIRVKEFDRINPDDFRFRTTSTPKIIDPSKQFSHLFNAYTQAVNRRFQRTGSLFENPFKRTEITDLDELKNRIAVIQCTPFTQNLCRRIADYKWTSYWSNRNKPDFVAEYFGNLKLYDQHHH